MNEEEALKKFGEMVQKVNEQFPDFLLIARPPCGGFMWRASDGTWGIGAAGRYIEHVRETDRMESESHFFEDTD